MLIEVRDNGYIQALSKGTKMAKRQSAGTSVKDRIKNLDSLKFSFSANDAGTKISLVKNIAAAKLLNPASLLKYHETLCFMQAYPDNPVIKKLADDELSLFSDRVEHFKNVNGYDDERIDDVGLADTLIRYPYNYIMSNWLVEKYGPYSDIVW